MRKFMLGAVCVPMGFLAAACTPGAGEYSPCGSTPDCQVSLLCVATGGLIFNDAGNSVADAGWCRYPCQDDATCNTWSEVCSVKSGGANGFCSKDGGY